MPVIPQSPESASWNAERHARAAAEMAGRLAAEFPRAGLALTGSVAAGVHTDRSDIDLLLVDDGLRREMQFSAESLGIPTAIVCLRPAVGADREQAWLTGTGGADWMMGMIRSARALRDPHGHFARLQGRVEQIAEARETRREELALRLAAEARALLLDPDPALPALLRLASLVMEGWKLRRSLSIGTKQQERGLFGTMAASEPELADLLREALPITRASRDALARAAERVFAPAP